MTQMNLGLALSSLGARENGTEKLEEAIAAYREALKEFISSNNYATGATLVPEQARGKFALRLKCGTVL